MLRSLVDVHNSLILNRLNITMSHILKNEQLDSTEGYCVVKTENIGFELDRYYIIYTCFMKTVE